MWIMLINSPYNVKYRYFLKCFITENRIYDEFYVNLENWGIIFRIIKSTNVRLKNWLLVNY